MGVLTFDIFGLSKNKTITQETPPSPVNENSDCCLPSLSDGKVWIGNASNVATEQSFSGAFTVSNTGVATLANSGVSAGTWNTLTVNNKGIVTAGSNTAYLTANQTITFTGAATGSGTTSVALTLANSGVVAGEWTKVTVNDKGLVVTGANIDADDIPDLNWSKITAGKPTTLAGYGIVDAQPLNGNLTTLSDLDDTSTNGIITKTANGIVTARTIAGTASNISVTNGDGVLGAPTINLIDTTVTPSTYRSVTVDQKGRVTGGTNPQDTGWTNSSTNYVALKTLGFDFSAVTPDDANFRLLARMVETIMRGLKTTGEFAA